MTSPKTPPVTHAPNRYKTKQWWWTRRYVLDRDGYRCQLRYDGCTHHARAVDHILEPDRGGSFYATSNLQAACTHCNTVKENRRRLRDNPNLARIVNNPRRLRQLRARSKAAHQRANKNVQPPAENFGDIPKSRDW